MPFVPASDGFVTHNLALSTVFFGCNNGTTATVVRIPNAPLTAPGGTIETGQMQINETQTESMVANGVAVMSQNDSAVWATCLRYEVMERTGVALPEEFTVCFSKYFFVVEDDCVLF